MSDELKVGDVREQVWVRLMKERALAYPYPPFGHHPNFRGAGAAAETLLTELFAKAVLNPGDTVLSYPDYVLKGVRKGLLERGVNVIVPAKHGPDYRLLDSAEVSPAKASTIAGAEKVGKAIVVLPKITCFFAACVAVSVSGRGLTKGYGFRLPTDARPAFAVVHDLQILEALPSPDLRLEAYATPEEVHWAK